MGAIIPPGRVLLPGAVVLRCGSASRVWKATESSPFSSMNRVQILESMVSRKSATLDRGSSTSPDRKICIRAKLRLGYLRKRRTRRAHLKCDVLVLLKNLSGVFEDLVYIFLSQLLKIGHSQLELFAHIAIEMTGALEYIFRRAGVSRGTVGVLV